MTPAFNKYAARWRELLRAGELSPESIARLRNAPRYALHNPEFMPGTLLDYSRETAGLERGTQRLLKEIGGTIHDVNLTNLGASIRDLVARKPNAAAALGHQLLGFTTAPRGGGFLTLPNLAGEGHIYAMGQSSPVTDPRLYQQAESARAAEALARRHEVDELRAARYKKQQRTGGQTSPEFFRVFREADHPLLRAQLPSLEGGRYILDWAQRVTGSPLVQRARLRLGPHGTVPFGQHISPFPVLQESGNIAMLAPDVAEFWKQLRVGEQSVLKPYGFQYGRAPTPQQSHKIQQAFTRGELESKLGQYKLSRRLKFRGLDISIETEEGEVRRWHAASTGEEGKTKMSIPYGYIRRTEGVDGDHVDVFVGPHEDAKNVYIIHQRKAPDFKTFDEDKYMLGFDTADEAKAAYKNHYNDDRFFGSMSVLPFEKFKEKVLATSKNPEKIAMQKTAQPIPEDFIQKLHNNLKAQGANWGEAARAAGPSGIAGAIGIPAAVLGTGALIGHLAGGDRTEPGSSPALRGMLGSLGGVTAGLVPAVLLNHFIPRAAGLHTGGRLGILAGLGSLGLLGGAYLGGRSARDESSVPIHALKELQYKFKTGSVKEAFSFTPAMNEEEKLLALVTGGMATGVGAGMGALSGHTVAHHSPYLKREGEKNPALRGALGGGLGGLGGTLLGLLIASRIHDPRRTPKILGSIAGAGAGLGGILGARSGLKPRNPVSQTLYDMGILKASAARPKTLSETAHEADAIARQLRGLARRHPATGGTESASNLASKTNDDLPAKAAYDQQVKQAAARLRIAWPGNKPALPNWNQSGR